MKMRFKSLWLQLRCIYYTWISEFRTLLTDHGVVVLMVLAPLAYPLLYGMVYKNEALHEVSIAVVDQSASEWSRRYLSCIDATPEVRIAWRCTSFSEARRLYEQREVHGIVLIPADFGTQIETGRQAEVSFWADMSNFLYYRALMTAVNFVSRDLGLEIQLLRLEGQGLTARQAEVAARPFTYSNNTLYNSGGGYASFLLPAVLVLILHQTLLLGIGMLAGISRECTGRFTLLRIPGGRGSVFSDLAGKALCYLMCYAIIGFYALGIIPHLFDLPVLGNPGEVMLFMLPFLLATIFLGLTLGAFFKNRQTSMLLILFSSVPLLFISGISWPASAIPAYWKALGALLPSTHGIGGYVKLNSMQASLSEVRHEYLSLWILAGAYFMTAYFARIRQLRSGNPSASMPKSHANKK